MLYSRDHAVNPWAESCYGDDITSWKNTWGEDNAPDLEKSSGGLLWHWVGLRTRWRRRGAEFFSQILARRMLRSLDDAIFSRLGWNDIGRRIA